jgi:hypothetical protein
MPNLGAAFGSPSLFLRNNSVNYTIRLKRCATYVGINRTLFPKEQVPASTPQSPPRSGPSCPYVPRIPSFVKGP